MLGDSLAIHSHPQLNQYFYDARVQESVAELQRFLVGGHRVHLFPEATIKTNKLPNGILVESRVKQTMLMPSILRDPGCGFLLFGINQLSPSQLALIPGHIMAFCKQLEESIPIQQDSLIEAMQFGTHFLNDAAFCQVDLESIYYEIDLERLSADLGQITNTLELKTTTVDGSCELTDLLGFIHTGSEYFPELIHSKWFPIAADYSYRKHLSSIDAINNGFYGLPDTLDEAWEYQQWILAAMNYCAFKRWWIFGQLKQYLGRHMVLEINLINDRCHAGLFTMEKHKKRYLLQSRGVQLIANDDKPYLVAGQRESLSYLLQKQAWNCPIDYLGHGTSYQTDDSYDYTSLLGVARSKQCLEQLKQIHANTPLELEKCLAYSFNAFVQKEHMEQFDLQGVALYPLVNYHGRYLRKVAP